MPHPICDIFASIMTGRRTEELKMNESDFSRPDTTMVCPLNAKFFFQAR